VLVQKISDILHHSRISEVEKALKYALRRCELDAMEKLLIDWKTQPGGIIKRHFIGML